MNKKDQPLISWLMTVYKSENVLERCFDSIVNQTYKNYEVIVVVDKNDIGTWDICNKYCRKDSRFKIVCKDNKIGIARALNKGLRYCKGKYIARMDGDDICRPERLCVQVEFLENHPEVDVCCGNALVHNMRTGREYLAYNKEWTSEEIYVQLLFGNCIVHPAVMFRNKNEKMEYPDVIVEDYAFWSEIITNSNMKIIQDVVLDYYVGGENNITTVKAEKIRKECINISRNNFQKELNINTKEFADIYFGSENKTNIELEPNVLLEQGYFLYWQIIRANDLLGKFEKDILLKCIDNEWRKLLKFLQPKLYPYYLGKLTRPFSELTKDLINSTVSSIEVDEVCNRNIVVYGTGKECNEWIKLCDKSQIEKIICFCDSDIQKQGMKFLGKNIISPQELESVDYDAIAIASFKYYWEIYVHLIDIGVKKECIIDLPIPNGLQDTEFILDKYMG